MNIQQQSFNMEQQNYAISSLQDTKATVEAMKGAAKQMKKEMKTINIDNVEDLQMEMEDLLEDSNEIQEVPSSSSCPSPFTALIQRRAASLGVRPMVLLVIPLAALICAFFFS